MMIRNLPNTNYVLRGLPNINFEQFLENKRPRERYGHAIRSLSSLYLQLPDNLLFDCKRWLEIGYLDHTEKWHLKVSQAGQLKIYYEGLLKAAWLCSETHPDGINTVDFNNPVGVFWYPGYHTWDNDSIPSHGEWLIHPGGMRQVIYKLFFNHDHKINTLCFNTYGQDVNFKHIFTSSKDMEEYMFDTFGVERYSFAFCADSGTLIPHCLIQTGEVRNGLFEAVQSLKDVVKEYKFVFEDGFTINYGGKKTINFKTENDEEYLRAFITIPYFKKYKEGFFDEQNIRFEIT